jgi:3-hydroxybutyryl-CoA dehydrogenase
LAGAAAAAQDRQVSQLAGLAASGRTTLAHADIATANLHAVRMADLPECGLVNEATREDLVDKRALFTVLAGSQPAATLLASNTSSGTSRRSRWDCCPTPARVLGLHLFNPFFCDAPSRGGRRPREQ